MTEYTATCRWAAADHLRAQVYGDAVHIEHRTNHNINGDVALTTDAARTFARGILALADEIDGGEVEAPALRRIPQVGDKVRIVRNAYDYEGTTNVGREGELREVTPEDAQKYRVRLPDDSYGWWCAEVEYVEEEAADTRPKVGDRLRVTEDNPRHCPVVAGDVITVVETDYDHDGVDCVRFVHGGDSYRWFIPLTAVEPVNLLNDAGLADWERDLIESAKASAPVKVGDRVEIVRGMDAHTNGRTGVVGWIDESDPAWPYRVDNEAGNFIAWAAEVRKVEVTEAAGPEPTPSSFAHYVNEAKALLTGTLHTGADIVALAAELADRG